MLRKIQIEQTVITLDFCIKNQEKIVYLPVLLLDNRGGKKKRTNERKKDRNIERNKETNRERNKERKLERVKETKKRRKKERNKDGKK